jgi:hypothetical protein
VYSGHQLLLKPLLGRRIFADNCLLQHLVRV